MYLHNFNTRLTYIRNDEIGSLTSLINLLIDDIKRASDFTQKLVKNLEFYKLYNKEDTKNVFTPYANLDNFNFVNRKLFYSTPHMTQQSGDVFQYRRLTRGVVSFITEA